MLDGPAVGFLILGPEHAGVETPVPEHIVDRVLSGPRKGAERARSASEPTERKQMAPVTHGQDRVLAARAEMASYDAMGAAGLGPGLAPGWIAGAFTLASRTA
jgi:hypothetical protein